MAKIESVKIEEPWEYNELYPILQDAFRVLYNSYINIRASRQNNPYRKPDNSKKWFLEDCISDDLIEFEFDFIKKYDYSFITQYKNVSAKTRIDIAVYFRIKFGKYYKIEIECKQLKNDNIDYIIDGGIRKFKSNKYSEKLSLAGMLLYNTKDDINNNIYKLNERIGTKINKDEVLQHFPTLIDDYQYTYKSTHTRTNNTNLDLYSCAFDFKDVIIK